MIHITEHKTGLKLSGFISLNTSIFKNAFCMKQCKNKKSICHHCYGLSMENTYRRLHKRLEKNSDILKTQLSDMDLSDIVTRLKDYNKRFIRFHSIGELSSTEHLMNFYNIAWLLPDSIFGLWTKRKDIVTQHGFKKPNNLSMVYSNPVIDKPIKQVPHYFNAVFNVVTYDYATKHNITPNCHGKCIECLNCYRPGQKFIAIELLKSDQTKIKKGILQPLQEVTL